jgi:NADH dehydrogenase FAD-containing subunit
MARIIVLGAGFAGLRAAIGAARKLDEIGQSAEVLVIDRNPYHNIRVRNYEVDLSEAAIPLSELLDPIGVAHRVGEVQAIDLVKQQVTIATRDGREALTYDRLVLALGSELVRPAIPGLAANSFDVDTYAAAVRLDAHLAALGAQAQRSRCWVAHLHPNQCASAVEDLARRLFRLSGRPTGRPFLVLAFSSDPTIHDRKKGGPSAGGQLEPPL